jgi:hypothetical protein
MAGIDEQMIADLKKSNEGTALALGAVSEVLVKAENTISQLGTVVQKLLAKADKEDEDEKKKKEEADEEESFAKLVKALQMAGFVTKGDATSFEHTGADSEEKKKPVKSEAGAQQDVIQGSIEQPDNLPKKTGELKKGEEDKKEDKKDDKKDEYPEVEKLKKDLAAATAQILELQKSQDSKIETAIEGVLTRMGFHKERKNFQPASTVLGADQNKLQKSADAGEDRITQLAKLSYADLRKLQMAEEAGQLPPEIRSLIS